MDDKEQLTQRNAHPGVDTRRIAVRKIRQALRDKGSSIRAWADANGYAVRTVYDAVNTWAGRTDRAPHGGLSRSIMADLRAELGVDLVPAPPPGRKAA